MHSTVPQKAKKNKKQKQTASEGEDEDISQKPEPKVTGTKHKKKKTPRDTTDQDASLDATESEPILDTSRKKKQKKLVTDRVLEEYEEQLKSRDVRLWMKSAVGLLLSLTFVYSSYSCNL